MTQILVYFGPDEVEDKKEAYAKRGLRAHAFSCDNAIIAVEGMTTG